MQAATRPLTPTSFFPAFLALLAFLVLSACGGGGRPPSALSYPAPPAAYIVNTAIGTLSPTVTGTVDSYSVAPALPAGLSLSATSGQISGTPTAVTASAAYTVTATNRKGSTTTTLTILVNPAAPTGLGYTSPLVATAGTAIAALNPAVTGVVASYAVSPALPAGLALNTTSGQITGTPTTATAQATYRVTATNVTGATGFDLTITVNAAVPPAIAIKATPSVQNSAAASFALREDGTVWAWGNGSSGELGQGPDLSNRSSPVAVQSPSDIGVLDRIVQISAGRSHVLALRDDGAVFVWGTSTWLGADSGTPQVLNRPRAVAGIGGVGTLSGIVAVSAGENVSAAVLDTGAVVTWGSNGGGGLGLGTTTTESVFPALVPGVSGVIRVSAGTDRVFAVRNDGGVYVWGRNTFGALGNGSAAGTTVFDPATLALTGVVRLEAGPRLTAALLTDGTVRLWGNTNYNNTGTITCPDNSTAALSPVAVVAPGSSTRFAGVSVGVATPLVVYNGAAYGGGQLLDDATNDCIGGLQTLGGIVGTTLGISRSWGSHQHVWTTTGAVYGFNSTASGELGVGNTTFVAGARLVPGFNLLNVSGTGTQVASIDFESAAPASLSPGSATVTGVQAFLGLGPTGNQFSGSFLRSATANTVTLTLNNLPAHSSISLAFLFAAIDSLDGAGGFPSGDFFRVTLDGTTLLRETFANATLSQIQTYVAPPGGELARRVDLGFGGPGGFFTDSAYDMSVEPAFQRIPHTSSTATFTFRIEGAGVQDINDESWALDNLRVTVQ